MPRVAGRRLSVSAAPVGSGSGEGAMCSRSASAFSLSSLRDSAVGRGNLMQQGAGGSSKSEWMRRCKGEEAGGVGRDAGNGSLLGSSASGSTSASSAPHALPVVPVTDEEALAATAAAALAAMLPTEDLSAMRKSPSTPSIVSGVLRDCLLSRQQLLQVVVLQEQLRRQQEQLRAHQNALQEQLARQQRLLLDPAATQTLQHQQALQQEQHRLLQQKDLLQKQLEHQDNLLTSSLLAAGGARPHATAPSLLTAGQGALEENSRKASPKTTWWGASQQQHQQRAFLQSCLPSLVGAAEAVAARKLQQRRPRQTASPPDSRAAESPSDSSSHPISPSQRPRSSSGFALPHDAAQGSEEPHAAAKPVPAAKTAGGGFWRKTNAPAQIKDQFFRIKMCQKFLNGTCSKGTSCTYAHSSEELREPRALAKTKICPRFRAGTCEFTDGSCPFAHGEQELRSTSDYFKTNLCKVWMTGAICPAGENCRHAHGACELRKRNYRRTELEKFASVNGLDVAALIKELQGLRGPSAAVPLAATAEAALIRRRHEAAEKNAEMQAAAQQQQRQTPSSAETEKKTPEAAWKRASLLEEASSSSEEQRLAANAAAAETVRRPRKGRGEGAAAEVSTKSPQQSSARHPQTETQTQTATAALQAVAGGRRAKPQPQPQPQPQSQQQVCLKASSAVRLKAGLTASERRAEKTSPSLSTTPSPETPGSLSEAQQQTLGEEGLRDAPGQARPHSVLYSMDVDEATTPSVNSSVVQCPPSFSTPTTTSGALASAALFETPQTQPLLSAGNLHSAAPALNGGLAALYPVACLPEAYGGYPGMLAFSSPPYLQMHFPIPPPQQASFSAVSPSPSSGPPIGQNAGAAAMLSASQPYPPLNVFPVSALLQPPCSLNLAPPSSSLADPSRLSADAPAKTQQASGPTRKSWKGERKRGGGAARGRR